MGSGTLVGTVELPIGPRCDVLASNPKIIKQYNRRSCMKWAFGTQLRKQQ